MTRDAAPLAESPAPGPAYTAPGTGPYRRITLALFLAGFATFSLVYGVQPLLPEFARDFAVSPAGASLALSLTTGALAGAIMLAAAVSEGLGRRPLMFASMLAAALLNLAAAVAPDWHLLLAVRALEGLVLGGVPAVAMAYLAEEIEPRGLGTAMGVYVAGNAFGGMAGRVLTGIAAEFLGWRLAMAGMGALCLAAAIGFVLLLPPSRNFAPRRGAGAAHHLRAWGGHLRTPGLPALFATGFLVMGAFVAVYNYAGFRLSLPPYALSGTAIGLVFTVYIFGMAASSAAGVLADRIGRRAVLPAGLAIMAAGLGLTLLPGLPAMLGGIVALTVGFFVAHATASSWVGRLATGAKGHASSLYLLSYYLGASVAGWAGGWFWAAGGWAALSGLTLAMLVLAALAAWRLRALTAPR